MSLFGIDFPVDGGVTVIGVGADGATVASGSTHLADPLLAAATQTWNTIRDRLQAELPAMLGAGDQFGDGWTLYDIEPRISPDAVITVRRLDTGEVAVSVVTGRHTVIATSTTPTVFGADFDPRFSLDFGLSFDYVIDLPPVAAPVSVTGFERLHVTGVRLDSQNLVGDLVKIGAAVFGWFSGTDLQQRVQSIAEQVDFAGIANAQLAGLNAALEQLAAKGYHYLEILVGNADGLTGQLGAAGAAAQGLFDGVDAGTQHLALVCRAPDRSGAIEGTISWPDSAGTPLDPNRLDVLEAITKTLPKLDLELGRSDLVARVRERAVVRATKPLAEVGASGAEGLVDDLTVRPIAAAAAQALTAAEDRPLVLPDYPSFVERIGGIKAYRTVTELFRYGPKQFTVTCTVPEPGGGQHATGRLLHMWADDKDGRRRRRYRVVDVETDQPLTVACALASDWAWKPRTEVTASPRNWTGTVTVHPPRPLADLLRDGSLRVAATLADGERRTVTLAQLEAAGAIASPNGSERSIIIVGGLDDAVDERGIIIVGGLGDEVSLNPQPLPPRELRARLGTRVIAEALRGAGWDGLRVRDDVLDRGGAIATTATPVVTDRFGELGLSKPLDTEIFVPDEENPAGWGTVTGIDFGVRKR